MNRLAILILLLCPFASADEPIARFGSPALRHAERPLALALDASGRRLVSGGPDGSLKLWDTATGRLLGRYRVKDGYASSLALADDGTLIAARFGDGQIHLVDAATMTKKRTIAVLNVESVALSRDGRLVAGVTLQKEIQVFETSNGLERIQGLTGVAVAFSPNGAKFAIAETGEVLKVIDAVSGRSTFTCTHLSADGVTALAWSGDGEALLSADAGATGRVRLWRVGQEQPRGEWLANGGQTLFAGERIVGMHDKKVTVRTTAGKLERTIGSAVSTVAVSADGTIAATAGTEPRISIWDLATGRQRWIEPDDLGTIRDLAATPAGDVLVAAERGLATWRPGGTSKRMTTTAPSSLVALGDDTFATIADGKLALRAASGAIAAEFDLDKKNAVALAISPRDRSAFVGCDDRTVLQYGARSKRPIRTWETPSPVTALAPTPDGANLVGVGRDGFARAWALDGNPVPQPRWSLRVARSLRPAVAVSADSTLVAVTSVTRLEVFEIKSGRRLFFGERTWNDGPFQAVAFSPDGRFVAAGMQGSAGGAAVWEVATGLTVARFEGGGGSITKLLVLPDYRLVAASVDDNVIAWDLAPTAKAVPTRAELQRAWENLIDPAGAVGLANERLLARGGRDALTVMAAGIADIRTTQSTVAQAIRELGSAEFATRETSMKALRQLGPLALSAVEKAHESNADPEVVQRAGKLINEFAKKGIVAPRYGKYGDDLRADRAVWALEAIGTPEAVALLRTIASDTASGAIARINLRK